MRLGMWHPKFIYSNGNMAFVELQRTQSLTRPTNTLPSQPSQLLITQFRLNTHNLSRVLQHQKQIQYSMLQIKPIPKNTFRPSASYFFIPPLFTPNKL